MKSESPFVPVLPVTFTISTETYFKLNIFNINSLIPHMECLIKDNFIQNAHITCLLETWLLPTENHPEFSTFNSSRRDRNYKKHYNQHNERVTSDVHSFRILPYN